MPTRPLSLPLTLLSSLALLFASGCVERLDKPPPPDTSELEDGFADPTGIVEGTPLSDIYDALGTGGLVESLCGYDPIAEAECGLTDSCPDCLAATALSAGFEAVIPALEGDDPESSLDGYSGVTGLFEVERICAGFDDSGPDLANGSVSLTVGFTGHGLDPVLYGEALGCQGDLAGLDVLIDGNLFLVYAERVPFDLIASTSVLMGFNGTAVFGGSSHDVRLAYYFRPDGRGARAFLVNVPGSGSFVFILSPFGLQLRGADGLFTCDVVTGTCTLADE